LTTTELLSDSTADVDRTEKKNLYQTIFHTPEYFWFSPITGEFAGFRLTSRWYDAIPADERGWRWSEVLGLYLGVVDGWLRYFEADGTPVLGSDETALRERRRADQTQLQLDQERQRAEQTQLQLDQERQRAEQTQLQLEQERQRAERLAQRLRGLGVDLDG
jgi:hypothetical protein